MYTIMLIDDEVGVRNSIKAKIDWAGAGFCMALEASNGEEALRMLESNPLPDLIFCDIRMPQMDGVAFMQACRERYAGIRVVVLSGYSDFEYMKSAIRFGAVDYLLKPIGRGELTGLVARIAAELEEEGARKLEAQREQVSRREQLQLAQEQQLLRLVKSEWVSESTVRERLQQLQLIALTEVPMHARIITAEMRIPANRLNTWSERKDLLVLAFQMLARELSGLSDRIFTFADASHPHLMFFLVVSPEGADRFAEELVRSAKRVLRLDCVTGIGETIRGLNELKNGYASSMLAWSRSTVHGAGSERNTMDLAQAFTPEIERKLVHTIENSDMKAFARQLQDLFRTDQDTPAFAFTFLAFRIILMFVSVAKKFEPGESALHQVLWDAQMAVRDYHSREQVMNRLHRLAELVMNEVRKTRSSSGMQLADAIRQYVDENYGYELTLSSLAEMFHLNETYLSGLFKQSAGMTFSDYVTHLRLNHAERLLRENELKLTDIATLVGYSSSSYFSTSFKKRFGVSPKEYREQHAGGGDEA